MTIAEIFGDKELKSKQRTETLGGLLIGKEISVGELIKFARDVKDPVKATCIEAMEIATKKNPAVATVEGFSFVVESLNSPSPRVRWESARVIGNTAHIFSRKLDKAIDLLLINAKDEGTVVRWSAAYALGEILKLESKQNDKLLPAIKRLASSEEKDSIRKVYTAALKKIG